MEFTRVFYVLALQLTCAVGCSNFLMENEYRLSGRTMDLGLTLPQWAAGFTLETTPRGIDGNDFGFVGFVPSDAIFKLERIVTGGLNEQGLSCDLQTLLGTVYPNKTTQPGVHMPVQQFCHWLLGSFGSVADAKQALLNSSAHFYANLITKALGGQHFSARDATGNSMVVEFTEGKLRVYEDSNDGTTGFGLMTNEPQYPWHVQNVLHYKWKQGLARPATTMPGTWYPDERYLRLHLVKTAMPKPADYRTAMMQAVHTLNTVTVPMGSQMGTDSGPGEGQGDHTLWGVIYDHINKQLYFRSETNQNLQRVKLTELNFAAGAARWSLPVSGNELPWFVDAVK